LKVVQISELAGCAGLYLLAEKDAVEFYEKLGFVKLNSKIPTPMFLSIKTIEDAID